MIIIYIEKNIGGFRGGPEDWWPPPVNIFHFHRFGVKLVKMA